MLTSCTIDRGYRFAICHASSPYCTRSSHLKIYKPVRFSLMRPKIKTSRKILNLLKKLELEKNNKNEKGTD